MPYFGHWYLLVFMLVCLGALIAIAIWIVSRATSITGRGNALRTLEDRFARGEIDQQEFEQRKAALRH